jgi:hypothetical protein
LRRLDIQFKSASIFVGQQEADLLNTRSHNRSRLSNGHAPEYGDKVIQWNLGLLPFIPGRKLRAPGNSVKTTLITTM